MEVTYELVNSVSLVLSHKGSVVLWTHPVIISTGLKCIIGIDILGSWQNSSTPPPLTNLQMWANTMRKIKRKPLELPLPWKINQKQDHICVGVSGISANIWNFANDGVMISTRFSLTLPADAMQKTAGSRRTTPDYQKHNHVVTAIAAAGHLMWLPCLNK